MIHLSSIISFKLYFRPIKDNKNLKKYLYINLMNDNEEAMIEPEENVIECKVYIFMYLGMILTFIFFVLLILLYPF